MRMAFEYGVILNGSQTIIPSLSRSVWFEYGVILNGKLTYLPPLLVVFEFEYGVIRYCRQISSSSENCQ